MDARNKYGLVIVLLVATYVTSVAAQTTGGLAVVMLMELLTLWLTFSASESRRAQRVAGVACVVVAAAVVVAGTFGVVYDFDLGIVRTLAVVSALLYLIAPFIILRHLLRRSVVDRRTVLGAVAVYLMIGMMFAFTYRAVALIQPDPAFFGSDGPGDNASYLFFSFVTLTTVGYGNLVPAANPGQSLAVLEAVVGQLFLVTALAKIVSAWGMPGLGQASPPPE